MSQLEYRRNEDSLEEGNVEPIVMIMSGRLKGNALEEELGCYEMTLSEET